MGRICFERSSATVRLAMFSPLPPNARLYTEALQPLDDRLVDLHDAMPAAVSVDWTS